MRPPPEITIVVPGVIVPWQRPRKQRHKDGGEHWHNKPEVESYLAIVRHEARLVMGDDPPLDGGVELSLLAVWLPPKSWSARKRALALTGLIQKTTRPDLDNSLKGFKDAVRGVVYRDDAQVVSYGRCAKIYGDRPRLEVRVTVVDQMPAELPARPTFKQPDLFALFTGAVA
jgi:Holliday junction resolvase RusA-like endonuclease